jgi:hypothetical protein
MSNCNVASWRHACRRSSMRLGRKLPFSGRDTQPRSDRGLPGESAALKRESCALRDLANAPGTISTHVFPAKRCGSSGPAAA